MIGFLDRMTSSLCWKIRIKSYQWQLVQERHDWHDYGKISYGLKIKSSIHEFSRLDPKLLTQVETEQKQRRVDATKLPDKCARAKLGFKIR